MSGAPRQPWLQHITLLTHVLAYPLLGNSCAQDKAEFDGDIVELTGVITENTTWRADTRYLMTGQVLVEPGSVLTIEAGTTINSLTTGITGLAPALVIKPGAKIDARGTASQPITFRATESTDAEPQRALWGGVIVLGRAPVNQEADRRFVEGISGIAFGGDDPADSSGILQYVRVWFGGREIGANNEINGFTFGGVGNGTVVDHLEVAYNSDDGFEFFGGTVNAKYLSAIFVGDDSYDTDWGYTGKLQYLFSLAGHDKVGRGFEMDNHCAKDDDGVCTTASQDFTPRSYPKICNATLIGPGSDVASPETDDSGEAISDQADTLMRLREGSGGDFRNLVAMDGPGSCLRISDSRTLAITTQSPPAAIDGDSLYFSPNNVLFNCAEGPLHPDIDPTNASNQITSFAFTTSVVDPLLTTVAIAADNSGSLNPLPQANSPLRSNADSCLEDDFFDQTDYRGAFKDTNWLTGWSWLSENGLLL